MARITVEFIHPPIPTRDHDYMAYDEDQEDSHPTGYGSTREQALNAFVELAIARAYDEGYEDGIRSK